MRPSRRTAATLTLLVVLITAATGCGSTSVETDEGSEYVALGDSYTAGAGMEPLADEPCRRSTINYPSLVATALKMERFSDRSCAGARLLDLQLSQKAGLTRLNAPQLDAVGRDTELVTIGLGMNDHEISTGLLLVCITPPSTEPNDTCKQYLQQTESTIHAQIRRAAADLNAALQTIAQRAPGARIVVVGYPRIAPEVGSCPDLLPVPEAQLSRLRGAMKAANQAWSEAAEQAGALYVDMYTPSAGHDICSDDPWVSGYAGVAGKADGLHPFPSYAEAVAAEIVRVLDD